MKESDRGNAWPARPRSGVFRAVLGVVALFAFPGVGALYADAITVGIQSGGMSPAGQQLYRFTYTLSGFDLRDTNSVVDEVDIEFNPALFGSLWNGLAGPGFDLLLFQPNNPPGAMGDYSALASIDHPALKGVFSVDVTWIGPGTPLDSGAPVAQTYFINRYDNDPSDQNYGDIVGSTSGTTAQVVSSSTPEPNTGLLAVASALLGGWISVRRRR